MKTIPESDGPSKVFRTSEQIAAEKSNRASSYYLRLYDPLCAAALNTWRPAAETGAVLKIFPFIRLGAVFQVPLRNDWLGAWLTAAFYAGFYFGNCFPEQAEEIAERALGGLDVDRLPALASALDGRPATIENIGAVFNILGQNWGPNFGETDHQHWVKSALVCSVTGINAATTAKFDPRLTDFVEHLSLPIGLSKTSLIFRVLAPSIANAEGKAVTELFHHPLLALAEVQYPITPIEKRTMLPFFHRQLAIFGVQSENECPVEDNDLVNWVSAALDYGQSLLTNQPHIVKQVFGEFTPEKLRTLKTMASRIRDAAGGLNASWLVAPLLEWHGATFNWNEPAFYGRALTRVINLADFAIWLPWLLNGETLMGGTGGWLLRATPNHRWN
ncbi:MAG TPA: hypothetical protein VGO67_15075 [Verrucomicrobiae bacterium]|jgi:hypothetical protein